jgi:peptidoglycan/LPS O-acetylase OafA/YrhL
LSVEWLFYALFPLLMLAAARLDRLVFIAGALLLVIAMGDLRLRFTPAPDGFDPHVWQWFIYCFPLFHRPTFLLGMAAGRLFLFGPQLSPATHAWIFALTSLVIVLLFCLAIHGGARTGGAFAVLAWPPLVLLGEASYSLYITHGGVLAVKGYAFKWLDLADLPFGLAFSSSVLLAVAASVLCFLYVEIPLRRRIARWRWSAASEPSARRLRSARVPMRVAMRKLKNPYAPCKRNQCPIARCRLPPTRHSWCRTAAQAAPDLRHAPPEAAGFRDPRRGRLPCACRCASGRDCRD